MSRKTRKLIWSAPLVAVFAVVGALAAFGALGLGGADADELHNGPQNLKVMAADGIAGRTSLVLTWEAPESGAPDMYRIDMSGDGDKWSPEAEVSGTMLTYTDDLAKAVDAEIDKNDDLDDPVNVTRYYRVFAVNSHGSGQVSTYESANTKNVGKPGAVGAFGAAASGPEAINLTWTVPDDGGSEILGYCVEAWSEQAGHTEPIKETVLDTNCKVLFFSSGPGDNDESTPTTPNAEEDGFIIRATPGSSYTHEGLRAGQTWNYTAYALNKYGHSTTKSNTRQVKTASANVPPRPGNLLIRRVVRSSTVVVNLYWTVAGDGGQDISAYRVEVSDTPHNWPDDSTPLPAAIADRTDTSTQLDYVGTATDGKRVAVINVPLANADPSPFDLQHTVALASDAGDMPATFKVHYRVRVETGATSSSRKHSEYTEGSITLTDTANPQNYAHDDDNPNAPGVVSDPTEVNDDTVPGEIKLTVTRSTPGGSSDYRVDISDDGGDTWTMVHRSTRPINETEYQHQGLKPDKPRHFRLFTKNGSNFGLASQVVMDRSGHSKPPDRVENLMAAKNGAGEVKVSWTAPKKYNGAMVDKYCVVMNQIGDNNVVIATTGDPAVTRATVRVIAATEDAEDAANCTRYGLPDLYTGKVSITSPNQTNGSNQIIDVDADLTMVTVKVPEKTRWQFEVYALNGATADSVPAIVGTPDTKKGLATASETVHDKTTAGMKPNMPRDLTAELARDTNLSGVGNQGVLLQWNQPASVPGAPVNAYKVERSKDGGEYEVLASSHTSSKTYYADTNEPAADEMRTYRVTAINIAGAGMDMATAMIPHPPTHTTHPPAAATDLAPPGTPSGTGDTTANTLMLTWTAGANADFHFVAGYRKNEDGTRDRDAMGIWEVAAANDAHTVDMGTRPAGTYKIFVIAGQQDSTTNAVTWSSWTVGDVTY